MTIVVDNVLKKESGDKTYYIGFLKLRDIFDAVFVPVRKKSRLPKKKNATLPLDEKDKGYQRNATLGRQRKIADFFIEHPESIIPPVLLSDRGKWKWNGDSNFGKLKIHDKAAVVDGQHRLGGFRLQGLKDEDSLDKAIPFVCVAGLTEEEEKNEFLTINNEQKGVQKQHSAVLQSGKWFNACAIKFNESGYFAERIQTGGPKEKWELDWKLHSIAATIKDVFSVLKNAEDPWGFDSDEDRKEYIPDLMLDYWEMVVDVFDEEYQDIYKIASPDGSEAGEGTTRDFEYKLLELTGYITFMRLLKAYSTVFWDKSRKKLNQDIVQKYLNWIKYEDKYNPEKGENERIINFSKKGKYGLGTGAVGARAIANDMIELISSKTGEDDNSD